jgi:hypothetical protein
LRMVCARFAQGFRKVYAGLRRVCLRVVFARFTQGLRKVYAGLR